MKQITIIAFLVVAIAAGCKENRKIPFVKLSKSDTFNVIDYGFKGDGSTNDREILDSIGELVYRSGGGIIYFPQQVTKTTIHE